MTAAPSARRRLRELHELEAWLQTPMILLSFVWLLLVVIDLVWGSSGVLGAFGAAIWVIFIVEFLLRLSLSPDRLQFLRRNWLTALALLLPAVRMLAAFRLLRLARAVRSLRFMRVVTSANRGMNALRQAMNRRGVGYLALLTCSIVLLGAAGMQALEPASEVQGGFSNYFDALWWTAMIITTMGTDFWPHTAEGRLLCLLLAIYGFAVWGYITATLATFFIGQEAKSSGPALNTNDVADLRREIALLRTQLIMASKR